METDAVTREITIGADADPASLIVKNTIETDNLVLPGTILGVGFGGAGYVRIGDLQIAWGEYNCSASSDIKTDFPDAVGTSSPIEFLNAAGYAITVTPTTDDGKVRFAQVSSRSIDGFTAQSFRVDNPGTTPTIVKSGSCGDYVAMGAWQ